MPWNPAVWALAVNPVLFPPKIGSWALRLGRFWVNLTGTFDGTDDLAAAYRSALAVGAVSPTRRFGTITRM